MPKGWRIAALALAFFALMGSVTYFAMRTPDAPPGQPNLKRLTGTIAEGLVYQASGEKFPRASCEACRIARKKLGVFTIGAFCTLEFDKLVVNLPQGSHPSAPSATLHSLPGSDASSTVATNAVHGVNGQSRSAVDEQLLDTFGLRALAQASGRQNIPCVVGLTINSLEMNRMEGSELRPIFRAAHARMDDGWLSLRDVLIYRASEPEHYDSARIVMSSGLSIEWQGGALQLVRP